MAHSKAEIALIKNALAAERPPEHVSPLTARRPSRRMPLPEVSAESRAEYAYALAERAGRFMDADDQLSIAEADRLALADLGSVEYWDYVANERWRERAAVSGPDRAGDFTPGDVSRQLDLWVRLSLSGAVPTVDTRPGRKEAPSGAAPDPSIRCSRCESIGHAVETCPFSESDKDVMRVARLRRERRARITEVA